MKLYILSKMKYIEKLKKESRLEAMFIAHVVAYWVCVFVNIIKENLLDGFFLIFQYISF
jgi:hypothetical protein